MRPWIFTVLLLGAACTDTNIIIALNPDSLDMRLDIEAEVCAPDPLVEEVPYKILFVIDTSLSNQWNDPNEYRVEAYLAAIESHVGRQSVYFAIVTFNDYAHRPTLVFTKNSDILLTAALQLRNETAGGGTNYEDAIQEMNEFIIDDLNGLTNPLEAARTHYQVYWLSDGIPTFGTTHLPTLVANVESVSDYLEPKVAEFSLNTLYLESSGEWESPEEIAGARDLLQQMAEAGRGTFTNIANGASFEFDIQPKPQIHVYRFLTAVANNQNVRFGARHPLPDSDGDGIVDIREVELGLDPALRDSDWDFYGDGVELWSGWLNPEKFEDTCDTGMLDSDGDLLLDCEEEVIGSDPENPDTDGDLVPDGIEYLNYGSVLSSDPGTDVDLDKLSDLSEVLTHMDPRTANTEEDRRRWAYRYQLVDEWDHPETGQACFTIVVQNVSVYETLPTDQHPAGWQLIDLVAVFTAEGGTQSDKFLCAAGEAGLLLPSTRYPESGTLQLGPADFAPMGD